MRQAATKSDALEKASRGRICAVAVVGKKKESSEGQGRAPMLVGQASEGKVALS